MSTYAIRRILSLIPILLGVTIIVFLFLHMIPGDPAQTILGEKATPQMLAELRHDLGLNDPLYIQYWRFISHILQGDLGRSILSHTRVSEDLGSRFPATVELTVVAMLISIIVGIPAGIISATKQYSIFDNISMFGALLGVSMPIFWLGLMLIWLFSLNLGWFPMSGRIDIIYDIPTVTGFYLIDTLLDGQFPAFINALHHLLLPGFALGTIPMAIIARMTRSSMLEVLKQDFIRTARAKGLAGKIVVYKHGLKNALIPIITVVGLQFGYLLSGAVMTETIFAWPGIGRLIVDSIFARDFPVIQGAILLVSTTFVVINLIIDLLYASIDPRIHYN